MKEQIQYLITFHTQAKEEVYNLLNEINKASDKIYQKKIKRLRYGY